MTRVIPRTDPVSIQPTRRVEALLSVPKQADSNDDVVIETRSLGVHYGSTTAVKDVSLQVHRHKITAIIGPSGCGKTSFISTLNRMTDLVPRCGVRGEVFLDGIDIFNESVDLITLRRRVGMIFQKPNPFPISIRRNIELPLREQGIRRRETLSAITRQALEGVGLWDEVQDRLDRSALSLSGGQQQRLCIARALALKPEVVLFDEPCSALDPISSGVVEDLIHSLRRQVTVVIVTHNLAQARRIADRVAMFWMRDGTGTLIEAGPADHVFTQPEDPVTASYVDGLRG